MYDIDEKIELISFMTGPDRATLRRLAYYFSGDSKKYLHPRELKKFWDSLTEDEKDYYHEAVMV